MGIYVALRTERGEEVASVSDTRNILHDLLPQPYTDSNSMLDWIDWYGNTMFNHVQMKRLLEEWDGLSEHVRKPEGKALLASIRGLAERCQAEGTLYLWFTGD